jgi:hypothetical protein
MTIADGIYSCDFIAGSTNQTLSLLEGKTRYLFQLSDNDRTIPLSLSNVTIAAEDTLDGLNMLYLVGLTKGNTYHLVLTPLSATTIDLSIVEVVVEQPEQPEPSEPEVDPDDNKGEEVEPTEPEVDPDDNKGEKVEPTEPDQTEPSEPEVTPDDNKGEEVEPTEPEQPEPSEPEVNPDDNKGEEVEPTEPEQPEPEVNPDDNKGEEAEPTEPEQPEPSEPEVNPDDNKGEEVEPTEPEQPEPETPEVTPDEPDQPEPTFPLSESTLAHFINYSSTEPSHDFGMTISDGIYSCDFVAGSTNQTLSLLEGKTRYLFQFSDDDRTIPLSLSNVTIAAEDTLEGLNMLYLVGLTKGNTYHLVLSPLSATTIDLSITEVVVEQPEPEQPEPSEPEVSPDDNKGEEVEPSEPEQPTEPETPEVTPEEPDQPTDPETPETPEEPDQPTEPETPEVTPEEPDQPEPTLPLTQNSVLHIVDYSSTEVSHDFEMTVTDGVYSCDFVAGSTNQTLSLLEGKTRYLFQLSDDDRTIPLSLSNLTVAAEDTLDGLNMLYLVSLTKGNTYHITLTPLSATTIDLSITEVVVEQPEPEQPEPSEPEVNPDDNKGDEVEPSEPEQPTEPETPEVTPEEPDQPTEPEQPEQPEPDQPESTFPLSESTLAHFINYSSTESSHDFEMTIADGTYSCDFVAGRTNQTLSLVEVKTRYLFQLSDDDRTIPLSLSNVTIAAEDTLDGLNMLYLVGLTKGNTYHLVLTPNSATTIDLSIVEVVVEQPDQPEQPEVNPDDNKGEEIEPSEPEQPEPSEPEVNPDDNKGEEVEPSEPEQTEPSEPEVTPDDNKGEEVEPTEPEQPEPSEPEVNPDDNKGEEVEPTEPEQPEPSEPEVNPDDNKGEEVEPTEPDQPTDPETPEIPEVTPDQPEPTFPLSESTVAHFINYSSTEPSHDFEMTIADGIYSCDFIAGSTNQTLSLLEGKTRYLFQLSDDDRTIPLSLSNVIIAAEDTLDGLNMLYLVGLTKGNTYHLVLSPLSASTIDLSINEVVVEQPTEPEPSEPEVNPDDIKGEEVEPTEPDQPEVDPNDNKGEEVEPTEPSEPEVNPDDNKGEEVEPSEPDQPTEPEIPEVTPDQPESTFPLSENAVAHFINYSSTESSHDFEMTIADGIYSCNFVAGRTNQTLSLLEDKTRYLFQLSDDDRTIPLSLNSVTIAAEDTLDGLNMLYLVGLTKGESYRLTITPVGGAQADIAISELGNHSAISDISSDSNSTRTIYTLSGIKVTDTDHLKPGVYIENIAGQAPRKIFIH